MLRAGAQGRRPAGARARRLDAREAELHELLAEHATDYERLASCDAELRDSAPSATRLEEAWLEAASLLEAG